MSITIHPVIAALRRHKTGVTLIALQIAVTLTVICNAVFIIVDRVQRMEQPTGIEEEDLIRISQIWLTAPQGSGDADVVQLDARQRADLAVLRALPDVQEAAASASMPLAGQIWSGNMSTVADSNAPAVKIAYYYGDEHLRTTLGIAMLAGRDFAATEIRHGTDPSTAAPSEVIVSKPVADALFPAGNALGKTVYQDGKPTVIVGIMAAMRTPTLPRLLAPGSTWSHNSVLEPMRLDGPSASYAVRAKPGRSKQAMHEARAALLSLEPMRLMPDNWGVQSFSQIRDKVYRGDRGLAILMALISLALVSITASGIVGLTSLWVSQRYKQIGIRRALGATKADILRHFQLENFVIAVLGVVPGIVAGVVLNLWLLRDYQMTRMPVAYVLSAAAAIVVLGQLAALAPALRAAAVPPVVATRSV